MPSINDAPRFWGRRRVLQSAAAGVAVIAIAGAVLTAAMNPIRSERVAFEKYIPASPASVLVTPAGASWWSLISAVSPSAGLSAMDPSEAPRSISAYGASYSEAVGTTGVREVYLQAEDEKAAHK